MKAMDNKAVKKLAYLKKTGEDAKQYSQENIDRYERFMRFVFKSSLDNNEMASLSDRGMPTIEFNILEAYISRLRGEFSRQQPSVSVRSADGVPISRITPNFIETLDVIEAHFRYILSENNTDMLEYNIYSDLLAGGFSSACVYNDYVNSMSFEQNIFVERSFDPTLCVFDPLARKSHRGDGRFCAELYPMTKKEVEERYGDEVTRNMQFTKSLSGFDWSFKNGEESIVLVCEFHEKQKKSKNIVLLTNGHSILEEEYNKLINDWKETGIVEQPPVVIRRRKSVVETIVRYRFCQSCILEEVDTDLEHLPLVYGEGNSVTLKDGGAYTQMTRPYVYHAIGIQKLKNLAGQSLGNGLENTVQHKFVVAIESIPADYQNAYQNVQKADTLIYNHFLDTNNPTVTLPAPREIVRTPIPPQISETFRMSDEMTQAILGSYDGAAGQNNGISGVAFLRSGMQSNVAATPFMVGYTKMLNRIFEIILHRIPKIYRTPRSIPVLLPGGKRDYVEINKPGSVYMNYDPKDLQVRVELGVNFALQKEMAMQTIVSLSQSMPSFSEFFGQKGLQTLLDNLDIRGIDSLKEKALEFEREQSQMQQTQMQMQAQQQDLLMKQTQKELQSPTQEQLALMAIQEKARNDAENTAIKERQDETKFLDLMNKIRNSDIEMEVKKAEIDAENTRSSIDALIEVSKHIKTPTL